MTRSDVRSDLRTVGHSVLPLERFLSLVSDAGVEALADVRRFPSSRRHPHFNREVLEEALPGAGIEYRWLEALGGRRNPAASGRRIAAAAGARATDPGGGRTVRAAEPSPNQGLRVAGFRGYADYALTAPFREALTSLLEWAGTRRIAICCAEGLWWQCHRRIIADHLVAAGHPVHHILPDGSLAPHELWSLARLTPDGPVYPTEQPDLVSEER